MAVSTIMAVPHTLSQPYTNANMIAMVTRPRANRAGVQIARFTTFPPE
jgi:hypothetical protein